PILNMSLVSSFIYLFILPSSPLPTFFPYTTLFRSNTSRSKPTQKTATILLYVIILYTQPRAIKVSNLLLDATTVMSIMAWYQTRSEEHTSELQSRFEIVCRLLLEK